MCCFLGPVDCEVHSRRLERGAGEGNVVYKPALALSPCRRSDGCDEQGTRASGAHSQPC